MHLLLFPNPWYQKDRNYFRHQALDGINNLRIKNRKTNVANMLPIECQQYTNNGKENEG